MPVQEAVVKNTKDIYRKIYTEIIKSCIFSFILTKMQLLICAVDQTVLKKFRLIPLFASNFVYGMNR